MTFAGAALDFREDHHADRLLAAVGLRRRADADEGAGLDVGERRADHAEHPTLSVRSPAPRRPWLLDHDGRAVDADNGADDTDVFCCACAEATTSAAAMAARQIVLNMTLSSRIKRAP